MTAVSNAQETLTIIGAGRDHQNVRPRFAHHPREFRKLNVVTNQDRDLSVRRIEKMELVTGICVPFLAFPTCAVNLVLMKDLAARSEVVSGIEQTTIVMQRRVRTADEMNVPLTCKLS